MIKDIIISLAITTLISVAVAYISEMFFDQDFTQALIAAFIVQVAVFYLWNSYMQYTMKVGLEREETARISMYESQGIESSCAYCNATNFIPVKFDEDNSYECTECDNSNSVYVQVTTARTTDILDRSSFEISTYIKEKVKAADKLGKKE